MIVLATLRRAAATLVMLLMLAGGSSAQAAPSVLTEHQAHEAFKHMVHMQRTGEIEFRFVLDGCYARAHLMTQRLHQLGIVPVKIWATAHDAKNGPLTLQSKHLPINGGWVRWTYHVAPAVYVKTRSGEVRKWVFDPSMNSSGPLDANTWWQAMRPRNASFKLTASSQYHVNGSLPRVGAVRHAQYIMRVYRDRYARRDFRPLSPAEMDPIAAHARGLTDPSRVVAVRLRTPHEHAAADRQRRGGVVFSMFAAARSQQVSLAA